MAEIKISELPQAILPPNGTEFNEIVQDGANKRIDCNDSIAGQVRPKLNEVVDPYNAELVWKCDLKVTPYLNNMWRPGYFCTLNRQGSYNPYDEDAYYTFASSESVGGGIVSSAVGGRHVVYETSLFSRGMLTTVSKRLLPDPFAPWDEDSTSATLFLDCATALPTNPTGPNDNAQIIFPYRIGTTNAKLVEPLVQTSASATTLTPARLTEVAEFTGLTTNATIAAPAGAAINGKPLVIRILASGADRTLTWNAYYRPIGVSLPATAPNGKWVYVMGYFNTASAKVDVVDVKVQA